VTFIPNRKIKVVGVGLYELHPNGGPFTLGWKYILENQDGQEIETSQIFEEQVNEAAEDHIIKYKF